MSEKRLTIRLPFQGRVNVYQDHSNTLLMTNARLKNISTKGFCIITDEPLSRGTTYRFEIDAFMLRFSLTGRVLHLIKEMGISIAGIKYEKVGFLSRCKINRLMTTKSAKLQSTYFTYAMLGGIVIGVLHSLALGGGPLESMASFAVSTALLHYFPPF